MEIRLQDIADELDVSVMTVSLAMRHDRKINPETRARVHEVARRLGYKGRSGKTPSATASATESAAKGRSVGLLLRHQSVEDAHRDSMVVRMMGGIMSVLDAQGMSLKLHTWPGDKILHLDEDPSQIPPMIQKGECGALIVQGYHEDRNLDFLSHRLPIVSLGRHYRDLPIDAVVADNVDGIRRMVDHLVKLGHQRLAWLGTNVTWSFTETRQAGFFQGCLQHGLEINSRFLFGPEIWEGRHIRDKDALLAAVEAGVTAFVCGNDSVAINLMSVLEAAGKRVPDDISVTGFDGFRERTNMRQLTGIDPCFFEMGKAAARLALQRIAHPMDKSCVVSVGGEIVSGDSTTPPHSA